MTVNLAVADPKSLGKLRPKPRAAPASSTTTEHDTEWTWQA